MSADRAEEPLARLRAIALALPEAAEVEQWEAPTFRVRGKIFALTRTDARTDAQDGTPQTAVWVKAPPGSQTILVGADPARFFVPPYLGARGWVGVVLDAAPEPPDWDEVAALVRRSFRLVAPKRLAARVAE